MKLKTVRKVSKQKKNALTERAIFFSALLIVGLVLTVSLVGKSQQYRQFAQTGITNYCSGLAIAASPDFKAQKSLACQFTSEAADKVMQTKAGCPTKAEAEAAVKEACAIANPPANGCVGEVVASTPSFKANQAIACGVGRAQVVDGLVANSDAGCTSKAQAQQAVDAACGGAAPVGGGAAVNFCSGYAVAADPEFKASKTAACGSAKSIAVDKVKASKAGCPTRADAEQAVNEACGITNPPAKICTGQVIAASPFFKAQNKTDLCGAFYANTVDGLMKDMPDCANKDEAKKALDEACVGSGFTPSHSSTPIPACSCAMLMAKNEFVSQKVQACSGSTGKTIAADTLYNTSNAGCTSRDQATQAVEAACTNACSGSEAKVVPTVISSSIVPTFVNLAPVTPFPTGTEGGNLKKVCDCHYEKGANDLGKDSCISKGEIEIKKCEKNRMEDRKKCIKIAGELRTKCEKARQSEQKKVVQVCNCRMVKIEEKPRPIIKGPEKVVKISVKQGMCFIATAAYGTPMAEDVRYLRAFRDQYLLTNELGRKFVALYYHYSPSFAEELRAHDNWRAVVRVALTPLVQLSSLIVDPEVVKGETIDKP